MDHAYATAGWENFFFAEVGAAAALIGLLFVATSINLMKILGHPSLPGRAFEAIAILAMVLLVGTFALVPGQRSEALGAEILGTAGAAWGTSVFAQARKRGHLGLRKSWIVWRAVVTQVATVPMMVAGGSLLLGRFGGLYWSVAGVVASFLAALLDAWILLIEIHR